MDCIYQIEQKFDGQNFLTRQLKLNFLGLKNHRWWMAMHQKFILQIFEDSVLVKIYPRQNLALYGIGVGSMKGVGVESGEP